MEPIKFISNSCKNFSTDLYKTVSNENRENTLLCPFGVHIVLAMAATGACGSTKSQMKRVLHLSNNNDARNWHGFQNLIEALNEISDIDIDVTTKMFVSDKLSIKPEFNAILQTHFYSESNRVDFEDKKQTVVLINDWCRRKTENNIVQIITPDDIKPRTAMILLSAVYFKAEWRKKFEVADTRTATFHVDSTTTKKVRMMFQYGSYDCGELNEIDAKFVELPYKSNEGNLKMVVIVPNKIEGLAKVEENMDKIDYNYICEHKIETDIKLYMPKFTIKNTINLSQSMKKMGMDEMFSLTANFRGISDKRIRVNRIIQKTFVEVDEYGTKATAVSEIDMELTSFRFFPDDTIQIDRPFLAVILYEDLPLFYARVVDPSIDYGGNEVHLAPENFPIDLSMGTNGDQI